VAVGSGIFAVKSADAHLKHAEQEGGLKRAIGAFDLTALGLGAIIGTGIFVILGEAIGDAGPAIVLSFILAGVTCAFSALSYSELASSIPISGSAYTYAYATLGELLAWIIGWDLILEYGVSVAAVAVGWGEYLSSFLDTLFGVTLPTAISAPPGEGGTVNLPAAFLVLAVTALLCYGVKESARANTVMVLLKIVILILFLVLAFSAFKTDNVKPFAPEGFGGVTTAAAAIFFAYIGFDAVSTSGEEVKNPKRDLPIAIIGSLSIATLLYCLVALAATGAYPWKDLEGEGAPLAVVLSKGVGTSWGSGVIEAGALIAITSVVLTVLYGQTRIMFAMSRDGLVPEVFGRTSKRQTPAVCTALFGGLIAILAATVPLDVIFELVNIGTLFAFVIVNVGVIVLRRTRPELPRGFRVPWVPVVPIIGALLCFYLMRELTVETWLRFVGWLALGLIIYVTYGRRHSKLQRGETVITEDV
jgi:APA family basic amino acid/polyamine antiporter